MTKSGLLSFRDLRSPKFVIRNRRANQGLVACNPSRRILRVASALSLLLIALPAHLHASAPFDETLEDIKRRKIAGKSDTLRLAEGRTFVIVSGLGGKSVRKRKQYPLGKWWASIHTANRGGAHGALFGVFNVDGQKNRADFTFKDISGKVVFYFTVISEVEDGD